MSEASRTAVPLPTEAEVDLGMPTAGEAQLVSDAILTATDVGDGPTPLQQLLCRSVVEARESGSVGPWAPGGITEFQVMTGRQQAEAAGRSYTSFGAEPPPHRGTERS